MKSGLSRRASILLGKMKYPIYILVAGYLISLSCIYVYSTPFIHDTFIGNIWIAIFGEGDQLFFVAFTFFVRESIKILSSESSISLIKIKIIGLVFYIIVLILYVIMCFYKYNGHDYMGAEPVLRMLFYTFLGWLFTQEKNNDELSS